jgi:HEAT repeat protein
MHPTELTHVIADVAVLSAEEPGMKTSGTLTTRILMRMLTGDPVEAMESAKEIIGLGTRVDPMLLKDIASNKIYKKWSRIAAVYALGFLAHKASAPALIRILQDQRENAQLRGHAAEALGNMRDPRAVLALGKILSADEHTSIKKWCVYALSEIGSDRAGSILKRFEATNPVAVLRRELKSTLYKFS